MYVQVNVFRQTEVIFFQDIVLMEVIELWNDNCVDNKILNIMQ
jgi:hypothetical protein